MQNGECRVQIGRTRMNTDSIISKVWGFCITLRDDGVGCGDYLEQPTCLIFLKMADEYSRRRPGAVKDQKPSFWSWVCNSS